MQIVSYRGPGMAGGVSPALTRLVADRSTNHLWWHIDDDTIKYANSRGQTHARQSLPKALTEGHYRYCNEFLWPIMHDLSEFATYRSEDRALYERFNRILAREIVSGQARYAGSKLFVQDYQLALLPKELQRLEGPGCGVFWHIPWPKSVPQEFLPAVVDVAKALLSAEFIGFHTQEYCSNFFNFVSRHIALTSVSIRDRMIVRDAKGNNRTEKETVANFRIQLAERVSTSNLRTKVIAAPLGLDVEHWQKIARSQANTHLHPALINTDYVLSVDRADYTKGVIPRLESIAHFFNDHADMIGTITFAQLCTRTRPGIDSFDDNWFNIQRIIKEINSRFTTEDWQPIVNLKGPLNASELSLLYANASMMLVNPLRDGLNLTAKEFIACQSERPGVLALSPHCGAYEELGTWAVDANPFNPQEMSRSVFDGLHLPEAEKKERLAHMWSSLQENTLANWCDQFKNMLEPQTQRELKTAVEAVR